MTQKRKTQEPGEAPGEGERWLFEYGPQLHRFLSRRVPSEHAADLAHEVYERFIATSRREVIRHPRALLYRLAANLIYEFQVRQKRNPVVYDSEILLTLDERAGGDGSSDLSDQLYASRELQRLLEKLPKKYQAVVLMRMHLGLTPEETAAELGIATTTVYRYLVDAIAIMKSEYFEREGRNGRNTR